jgi:hypothetical protein
MIVRVVSLVAVLLLSGCDLETLLADPKVVQREADSKAIGGACRHGMRSIEDCYAMNEKASKAAMFTGWREMDQYMRDNNIEGIAPKGVAPEPATSVAADEEVVAGPKPKKAEPAAKPKAAETKPAAAAAAAPATK